MRKKNATVWEVRFKNKTSSLFQDVGSSIEVDKRLYKEDIRGSIAHTNMLGKQKIISQKKKFEEWLSVLYYGAKKEFSDINGPFIKIY